MLGCCGIGPLDVGELRSWCWGWLSTRAGAAIKSLALVVPFKTIPCELEKMLLERIESPVPDCTSTPGSALNAIVFPWPLGGAADRVVGGVAAHEDAVDLVAQRRGAGAVGADVVPLDQVGGRGGTVDLNAPLVGGDHVAGRRRGAADRVIGGTLEQDPLIRVSAGHRSPTCRCRYRFLRRDSESTRPRRSRRRPGSRK